MRDCFVLNPYFSFELCPFQAAHGAEVIGWAQTVEEARRWAGPCLPWPLDSRLFPRWHADPDVKPYVLCLGEELIGYGELWVDPVAQEAELARLLVKPSERGQGVGRWLVLLLLEKAAQTGYPQTFVRVFPDNQQAIACYRRAGFCPVPEAEQAEYNQGQPMAYLWMQWDGRPSPGQETRSGRSKGSLFEREKDVV